MRILLQVVQNASVVISGEEVASIQKGYLLFVGFTEGDDASVARKMAEKVCKLRLFPDETGKTNKGLKDVDGQILSVSQFTLYASVKEGNRPSFTSSMSKEPAGSLYETFFAYLKELWPNSRSGVFHADMKVGLVNDGPFTLILDSKELFA
ncbi:MAG: D-tyrosyl-tRNA(Tyr) deacylase [Bacilli bacterium]|nr:D-tyrosyl-tRNA(Tyr) deacylase [Bacilli bacterium]